MDSTTFIPHRAAHRLNSAIDAACPGPHAVYSIITGEKLSDSMPLSQALDEVVRMGSGSGLEVRPAV